VDSDSPPTPPPFPALERLVNALMVELVTPVNHFVSPRVDPKERDKQLKRSKQAHPCQPVDQQKLGEYPPLEAVPPLCRE